MTLFAETPSNYAGVHTVCMCARLIRQSARIKPKVSQAGCEFGAAKAKNKSGDFQRTQHTHTHARTPPHGPVGLLDYSSELHISTRSSAAAAVQTRWTRAWNCTLMRLCRRKTLGRGEEMSGRISDLQSRKALSKTMHKCSSLNSEQHYICFSKE